MNSDSKRLLPRGTNRPCSVTGLRVLDGRTLDRFGLVAWTRTVGRLRSQAGSRSLLRLIGLGHGKAEQWSRTDACVDRILGQYGEHEAEADGFGAACVCCTGRRYSSGVPHSPPHRRGVALVLGPYSLFASRSLSYSRDSGRAVGRAVRPCMSSGLCPLCERRLRAGMEAR